MAKGFKTISEHKSVSRPCANHAFAEVPNGFLETLSRTALSPYESRILLAIARMTWGERKESETTTLRRLADSTGIDRRNVHRAVAKLKSRRLIVVSGDDRRPATYRIDRQPAIGNQYEINTGNHCEITARNQHEINMTENQQAEATNERKVYRSIRFPSFAIRNVVKFKNGFFETDNPKLQSIIESNDWFGIHIEKVDGNMNPRNGVEHDDPQPSDQQFDGR